MDVFNATRPPVGTDPAAIGDVWEYIEGNRRYTCTAVDAAGLTTWAEELLHTSDDLLPQFLNDDPFWAEMVAAIDSLRDECVDRPVRDLRYIRNSSVLPRTWKIQSAKLIGVDVNNLQLTDAEYGRLLEFLVQFQGDKGTMWLQSFLSFVKDVKVQLVPQWTNDHITFVDSVPESSKLPIFSPLGAGTYYLSSHFRLSVTYNAGANPSTFNLANFTPAKLTELYYLFGPMTVVLLVSLTFTALTVDLPVYSAGAIHRTVKGTIL